MALLMALVMVAVPTAAPAHVAALAASQAAPQVEYQAEPIPDTVDVLGGTRGAYGDVSSRVDADASLFVGFANENTGNANETWAEIHKYSPTGVPIGTWYVNPSPHFKVDSVELGYSGNDLLVHLTTHSYEVLPRTKQAEAATIPDVFAYDPLLLYREGASGAYVPAQGQGGTAEIDYARIQAIVKEEVEAAMRTTVANIIPKTRLALQQEAVLTLNNVYTSDGLYARIRETSYQSNLEALRTYFPTPAPTPRE